MYCYEQNSMAEITALLAHEVKNPVSLIKANIELLELDEDLFTYQKNISIIKKELNKINQILSDFISLAKPIDIMNLKKISIFDILQEIIDDFSISMQKDNINFNLNCFCNIEDTFILSDYSKIYILFLNIYKNAVESIDLFGNVRTNIYKKDNFLIVDIVDDGSGINDNIKNSIEKPFFTSKPNGSGLGISICKGIVNEFKGDFQIFNNSDKGCTARISFKQ